MQTYFEPVPNFGTTLCAERMLSQPVAKRISVIEEKVLDIG
jgi:hypothetical protein